MEELIVLENDNFILNNGTSRLIADFETRIKELKEQEDDLKSRILAEMEEKGIVKLETDDLVVSYIASTDREDFDKKKFKEDNQDLYDEYVKMTPVKSSIRIKVKQWKLGK